MPQQLGAVVLTPLLERHLVGVQFAYLLCRDDIASADDTFAFHDYSLRGSHFGQKGLAHVVAGLLVERKVRQEERIEFQHLHVLLRGDGRAGKEDIVCRLGGIAVVERIGAGYASLDDGDAREAFLLQFLHVCQREDTLLVDGRHLLVEVLLGFLRKVALCGGFEDALQLFFTDFVVHNVVRRKLLEDLLLLVSELFACLVDREIERRDDVFIFPDLSLGETVGETGGGARENRDNQNHQQRQDTDLECHGQEVISSVCVLHRREELSFVVKELLY